MKVPKEAVAEFRELYKKKCGVELSQEEAEIQARDLLTLVALSLGKKNVF